MNGTREPRHRWSEPRWTEHECAGDKSARQQAGSLRHRLDTTNAAWRRYLHWRKLLCDEFRHISAPGAGQSGAGPSVLNRNLDLVMPQSNHWVGRREWMMPTSSLVAFLTRGAMRHVRHRVFHWHRHGVETAC